MALLTAEQIAAAIIADKSTYAEQLTDVNAYVVMDVLRREYPSVDIENVTGQEKIKDVPTTNQKQTYIVHLYYRTTGFGDADEPDAKALENNIFDTIDALQDTTSKITITESWKREHLPVPTPHIHSELRVVTDEISSTKVGGSTGDKMTITFPAPLGELKVTNLITDLFEANKDMDLSMTSGSNPIAEEIHTLKHLDGLVDVEVVLTPAQELQLDALFTGNDMSITITKGTTDFVKTANLITRTNRAQRKAAQTTIVSMDIK